MLPRLAGPRSLAVAGVLLLAGCSSLGGDTVGSGDQGPAPSAPVAAGGGAHGGHASASPGASLGLTERTARALPDGGREVSLPLPEGPYTPSAPNGGTDDYRCFLLDPGVRQDTFLTQAEVVPGDASLVHHAILFRVAPDQVGAAERMEAESPGQGWTCFGDSGIPRGDGPAGRLDDSGWLGAWAPGSEPVSYGEEAGVPVAAGSRIVLQVHYNLHGGTGSDSTGLRLRFAQPGADLVALRTVLLAAPVELPCTDAERGPLCDRQYALEDLAKRFGPDAVRRVAGLQLLCDGDMYQPTPSSTQTCNRPVTAPMTVRSAAGHMHLLGRSIRVTVNPGRDSERTLLDIPVWNFDDQRARPVAPVATVGPGDVLQVRCTWDAGLRARLPALQDTPARYVTWGEGTTDEMCLAILAVSDA